VEAALDGTAPKNRMGGLGARQAMSFAMWISILRSVRSI
jgi:hypothetical protein